MILPLRPGDIAGDQRHDGHAENADENLCRQRARTGHQGQTGGKGEEDTDAKYRERLLATNDERLEDRPLQSAPVLRQKSRREENNTARIKKATGRRLALSFVIETV